jgi:hypothetical protein
LGEYLQKHALEPFMYAGNSFSSSLETVVLRLPLGSNDQENSSSFHPNIDVNYLGGGTSSMASQVWEEVIETHYLPTPDTVGASMTSDKVRIDTGTIPSDNVLSVNRKSETSTLDRQPPEYEDLGIFFSPTSEINEDIIYTLGSFRMDDFIGSPLPSAQSSSIYKDLKNIQKVYNKKVKGRYNYWDYIKLIQEFDHTLFKIIEEFVPFKANTKTGLLIEPTFLERNKFQREIPIRSDGQTMTTGSHQTFEAQLQTYNSESKLYAFATSSDLSTIKGQAEPGSYVISHNNLSRITESKYSERIEEGTNATIEIYNDHLNPFNYDPNGNNNQSCQAPVQPFTINRNESFGVGYAAIGSSFVIGNYYLFGGNTLQGIGSSTIGSTFNIGNYGSGIGIGNAIIGSTFKVGSYDNIPRRNFDYVPHRSNILLGNAVVGRKSKKYFKYTTYSL